jgi:predicted MFS family arabinose efflux permease
MMNSRPEPSATSAVLVGMLALASAMGIGRFALTPIMPLMQQDAGLTIAQGSWLAAGNYLGYLAGALACIAVPPRPAAAIRCGLWCVATFTLSMGLTRSPLFWFVFRMLAGAASAMVLVGVSAWAMPVLQRCGKDQWSGGVFAGVGVGIACAGLLSLAAGAAAWGSQLAWIILGGVAAALALALWHPLALEEKSARPDPSRQAGRLTLHNLILAGCYGAFGYGYIIPATFLPALARGIIDKPVVFGLVWPVFGVAAAISTVVAARLARQVPSRWLWVSAQWILAAGVAAPVFTVNVITLTMAALCVGGSFMVITMAGIKEALRLGGTQASRAVGLMTAGFAVGQIVGPLMVNLFAGSSGAFAIPSLVATFALIASNGVLSLVGDGAKMGG